ncbi:hypothetical protein Hs30E_03660 [Lactococcus hodotermopsidis]|uniref:Uncharacterized protein n=1 Tax=Pseudolactococcus hodotermopsidis TaxID=2709157 RepID=A0A6A0BAX6_9LACT|nr:hypothetical protein [Lactococcus hodotermopsidis]GFH41815.1 hypothetical protein Hs30E_03660 [Lactococcus hodotermopsidis]
MKLVGASRGRLTIKGILTKMGESEFLEMPYNKVGVWAGAHFYILS